MIVLLRGRFARAVELGADLIGVGMSAGLLVVAEPGHYGEHPGTAKPWPSHS